MLLTSSVLLDIFILLAIPIVYLYFYTTRNFDYWKKRNVHGPKPLPFVGNIWNVVRVKYSLGQTFSDLYKSTEEPYLGIFVFDEPGLVITSPEIAKNILTTDFNFFKDRTIAAPTHDTIFANAIFVQKSPDWRNTRTKLSPVFTSGKMKNVFPDIKDLGKNLIEFLKANPGRHDAKDICYNHTIDVIAKCFFGIDAQSFQDEDADFSRIGKAMFRFSLRNVISQSIYFFKTSLVNSLKLNFFNAREQQFFINTFIDTVKKREKMEANVNDFIGTLMEMSKLDPSFGK